MDKIWDRKSFEVGSHWRLWLEVGSHWRLWRGWKNEWRRRTDNSRTL